MKSLIRGVLIFLGVWGLVLLLGKYLELSSLWPVWVIPLGVALAAELILWSYRYERQALEARRGHWLLGLRLTSLAVLAWILLEPVYSRFEERDIRREVVILIDSSASMNLTDDGQSATRSELALAALERSGLKDELEGKVAIREVRAARRALLSEDDAVEGWDQATDIAGALDEVMEQVPPDQLAGVVLLSDGRHNRPGSVEDAARRYGILDAPIAVIPSGSETPPKDAAIVSVRAPDSVYLGDRVRMAAKLKFDGYRGQRAKVTLFSGDEEIESREVAIPQDHHREEVRFRHVPDEGGIGDYRIVLSDLADERFDNNNEWSFKTVVTDARTNVLIIEGAPRWEFRYLRNLFYGRDQSIHLQSVLLEPDRIVGQEIKKVPASASRPFGDSEATALPESEEEWRKFDVIIIGDLEAGALSNEEWEILQRCVVDRAALLVIIAGPRAMPHAFSGAAATALIPVDYEVSRRTYFGGKEKFKIALTNAGRSHPIAAQVEGQVRNEQVWAEFPELRWRHPITGVKEGAEVLLYAEKSDQKKAVISSARGLENALAEISNRRAHEAENALLVTRQTGNGKVAMLLTDRTWRLREGVGDVYHHRFWGQLVRWGAGPNLRSGVQTARVGTDQLTYTGDDPVSILARLREENLAPIQDETLQAEIMRDGSKVATVPLNYREGSNGIHQAQAGPFREPGEYQIRLKGDALTEEITTNFRVVGSLSAIELAETTLNKPLLENVAKLSGGRMVTADDQNLADLFLRGNDTKEELRETTLWDQWLLMLLLAVLLTSEWVLRRRSGLS
ncbi:hypothetical protein N9910_00370 [bacterium]|nr:hypothetical protein [bacterium]MDB4298177.1 hypothetical protein [bacterium]MDB4693326.1 hypothetical protein [Akkermansiaceae bacterium]MDB4800423.1 hypothetical protein [bacterium]MDC1404618.1 hypothetical protein [Akkermansiaceae bacterium]